jgi:hypothetical protein
MSECKKRQRFNVRTLERYEFVDYIINHLKNILELRIESSRTDNHLKFSQATVKEKNKRIKIAIAGYGGSGKNLRDLPTPLQTELLPLVFNFWLKVSKGDIKVFLLVLGHSFDEVFLRKMRLLNDAIPNLRIIQFINVYRFSSIERRFLMYDEHCKKHLSSKNTIRNEVNDFHASIVDYLKKGGELNEKKYYVLDCEVPAGEGTVKSEMIDVLALERKRRWLSVIELKYEKLDNKRLQSSIFQGLDYCNWVEEHKEGLAMLFPDHNVDTRRRTRLIMINGPQKFPEFHKQISRNVALRDRYQEIEMYYSNDAYPLSLKLFAKD